MLAWYPMVSLGRTSTKHTRTIPFKSSWIRMIFLLYRWDMDSFPGGYIILLCLESKRMCFLATTCNKHFQQTPTPSQPTCGAVLLVPQTKDLKFASQRFKEKTCVFPASRAVNISSVEGGIGNVAMLGPCPGWLMGCFVPMLLRFLVPKICRNRIEIYINATWPVDWYQWIGIIYILFMEEIQHHQGVVKQLGNNGIPYLSTG